LDESCMGDTCTRGAVVAEEEDEKDDDDAEEKDEGVVVLCWCRLFMLFMLFMPEFMLCMFIIPPPLSLWPENNDNEDKD